MKGFNGNSFNSLVPTYTYFYLLLFPLTFLIILPAVFHNKVYSYYYISQFNVMDVVKDALKINGERREQAERYFANFGQINNPTKGDVFKNKHSHFKYAIGILSTRRFDRSLQLGYVVQVAASLHQQLKTSVVGKNTAVFVCNVDPEPLKNEDAMALSPYMMVVMNKEVFGKKTTPAKQFDPYVDDTFDQQKQDYMYCMMKAAELNPKYVIILEDDALPEPTFLDDLDYIIETKMEKQQSGSDMIENKEQWFFLKLYYPLKWKGYSKDVKHWLELTGLGIFGGTLFAGLFFFITEWLPIRKQAREFTKLYTSISINFLVGAVYMVLLAVTIGRPYIQTITASSLTNHHVISSPGCCTQGMLYPTPQARKLAHNLASVKCDIDFSVDLAIDKYGDDMKLKGYLVEPNLLKHIGLLSSVRSFAKEPAEFLD